MSSSCSPSRCAGLKLGDRFLGLGTSDPDLAARLAGKVGLTGAGCSTSTAADSAAAGRRSSSKAHSSKAVTAHVAAVRSRPFDAVVMRNALGNHRAVAALRGDGEVSLASARVAAASPSRTSRAASWRSSPAGGGTPSPANRRRASHRRRISRVRLLAEREGIAFVEGVKAAGQPD